MSKLLSLVLRHQPEVLGLKLDPAGWVEVDLLLEALAKNGQLIDRQQLEELVRSNRKQRFSFSPDGLSIRANQGHSLSVDLGLEPRHPEGALFHGTAERFVDAILRVGLKRMERQFVHLSEDRATANSVGSRHGKPVIFKIKAKEMQQDGSQFFKAENGVWLVKQVSPKYLEQLPS